MFLNLFVGALLCITKSFFYITLGVPWPNPTSRQVWDDLRTKWQNHTLPAKSTCVLRIWATNVWTWVCQRQVVVPLCVRPCSLVHACEPVVGVKARSWRVDKCSTKWRWAQRAKSSVNAWLQEFARDIAPHVLIIDWRLHLCFLIVCLDSRNDSSMAFDRCHCNLKRAIVTWSQA